MWNQTISRHTELPKCIKQTLSAHIKPYRRTREMNSINIILIKMYNLPNIHQQKNKTNEKSCHITCPSPINSAQITSNEAKRDINSPFFFFHKRTNFGRQQQQQQQRRRRGGRRRRRRPPESSTTAFISSKVPPTERMICAGMIAMTPVALGNFHLFLWATLALERDQPVG